MVARKKAKPTTAVVGGKKVKLAFPGAAPPFAKKKPKKKGG